MKSLFFPPNKPTAGVLIWGVGPAFLLCAGSDDQLSARKWRLFLTGVALACGLLGVPAALGCGFHDGGGMDRGMLNFLYPGALSVETRTWRARQEGLLAGEAPLGYLPALAALRQWQARLEAAGRREALPSVAVVLVGPMLWSRYEVRGGAVLLAAHVDGPRAGDVVVVTDAAVLAALASQRLTLREARELGVISFYGEAAAMRAAIQAIE